MFCFGIPDCFDRLLTVLICWSRCWSTIPEACALFRSGACTPSDLLDACFARIDATEPTYNSFVLQTRATAFAAAAASTERWRKGQPLSALDGIPMGVKDIYDTAGVCTAGGCYAYRNRVPTEDCAVVARLKAAGAVLVGKTFTVELASGGLINPQYRDEVTTNPWDCTKQPGGSSSGSAAAVAGGQVVIATGSCTGGSIRGPAAYCGLSGFVRTYLLHWCVCFWGCSILKGVLVHSPVSQKPTYGLISKRGIMPLSRTLDHAGPIARTAQDCAIFVDLTKGYDPDDLDSVRSPLDEVVLSSSLEEPVDGLTLGVIPTLVHRSNPDVLANFNAALDVYRELGCTIVDLEPLAGSDANADEAQATIMQCEKATYIAHLLAPPHPALASDSWGNTQSNVSPLCQEATGPYLDFPAQKYIEALHTKERVTNMFEAALSGEVDALVMPTRLCTAPKVPADLQEQKVIRKWEKDRSNTAIFNVTGQPAISIPTGFDALGLPTSIQVAAAKWEDAVVLRLAHAFQSRTDHHLKHPTS